MRTLPDATGLPRTFGAALTARRRTKARRMNRKPPIKSCVFVLSVSALTASTADARSLQIHGVTGYLSEYDLNANVSGEAFNGREELSGPLRIKHVGVCTHDGPVETVSDLKLEFVDMASPVTATLNFDGHACSYRGHLSETEVGALICADGLRLPLRLWADEPHVD